MKIKTKEWQTAALRLNLLAHIVVDKMVLGHSRCPLLCVLSLDAFTLQKRLQ